MLSFNNDYSEGAHPKILDALINTNFLQTVGYGLDEFCEKAKKTIKNKIKYENCDIYFISGGTQTNTIAISHTLKPYEAVIACKTGHISIHETGAIESTGHKVIEVNGKNFKITKQEILEVLERHCDNHTVKPKMVYISNTTELGTHYTKNEIIEIYNLCKENNLYLYIDGARLSSALTVANNDMLIEDYPKYCDMFYIGGTKCGALFGEALIVVNDELKKEMDYTIKQKGGLFAKGRLLGIQFDELFKDNLYMELGKHSNNMAMKIKEALVRLGFKLFSDSYSNQIFVSMTKEQIEKISKEVICSWENKDENGNSVVRFVTSWATKEEDVDKLISLLETL